MYADFRRSYTDGFQLVLRVLEQEEKVSRGDPRVAQKNVINLTNAFFDEYEEAKLGDREFGELTVQVGVIQVAPSTEGSQNEKDRIYVALAVVLDEFRDGVPLDFSKADAFIEIAGILRTRPRDDGFAARSRELG